MTSYRSAAPASLAKLFPDARQLVFEPTVLLLDEAFQIRRRITAGAPHPDCRYNSFEPVFTVPVTLAEAPAEAAYLIVLTTQQALQADRREVCGLTRHGMSPIGHLTIETDTLSHDDPPLRALLPIRWYPDAPDIDDVGLLGLMTGDAALLALGGREIQVFEEKKGRYTPRLRLPYEQLLRAAPSGGSTQRQRFLSVSAMGVAGAISPRRQHHTFELLEPSQAELASVDSVSTFLAARIAPGRDRETVLWRVVAGEPTVDVGGPAAASRIGQAAATGGALASFPCGLCQTGACTPDLLVSCGALFSVGAVLGGLAGGGHEWLAGSEGMPKAERQKLQAFIDVERQAGLGPARLAQCLATALREGPHAPWRDQGRVAVPSMAQEAGGAVDKRPLSEWAAGYEYGAEVTLTRIALLPAPGRTGPDGTAMQLHLEARLRVTDLAVARPRTARVNWVSEPHPGAAWAGPALVSAAVADGCHALAARLVQQGADAWAGRKAP